MVLKNHLINGYTVNERRLAEKGLSEMEQTIALLAKTKGFVYLVVIILGKSKGALLAYFKYPGHIVLCGCSRRSNGTIRATGNF